MSTYTITGTPEKNKKKDSVDEPDKQIEEDRLLEIQSRHIIIRELQRRYASKSNEEVALAEQIEKCDPLSRSLIKYKLEAMKRQETKRCYSALKRKKRSWSLFSTILSSDLCLRLLHRRIYIHRFWPGE